MTQTSLFAASKRAIVVSKITELGNVEVFVGLQWFWWPGWLFYDINRSGSMSHYV